MARHVFNKKRTAVMLACLLMCGGLLSSLYGVIPVAREQDIYVPAYSHIYYGDRERSILLAVTVSIRNTDQKSALTILSVDYYDTAGRVIGRYLDSPKILAPLESVRYVVRESDTRGGSGANFIVRWKSNRPVNTPLVEAIMIGTQNQQGISFTSRGQVIRERK